ncbi:MAG: NB-ARC domain-containing protein [Xenococcaceae cyanobacterium MO_188.B19]|nr:NB-ARC domain-containing protein [Xenococcaceae cyanobacterium MO_188.B19]
MNVDQALLLVDEILATNTGTSLNDLQYVILKDAWQGKTYAIIADEYGCTEGHAKDVGYLLWKILSKLFGKKVTKNNFRTIIEQHFTAPKKSLDQFYFPEPQESSQFLGRQESLTDIQNLVAQNHKIIVIQGEGGVGKTTLARHFLDMGDFDLILEVLMAKETPNIVSVKSLLEEWFYKDLQEESGKEFGVTLSRFKRQLQTRKIGVFIDNLEPALDKDGKFITPHRNYVELLRILGDITVKSLTLITSRDRVCEADINLQHYRLSGLSLPAWEQYFTLHQITIDSPCLSKIHHIYGGNAKAMGIICGNIKEDFDSSLKFYWQENSHDPLAETNLRNLIASQFNRLKKLDYSAYILLCRLGCYRYQDIAQIPVSGLIYLLWDLEKSNPRNVIESLKNRSLVEFERGKYWLHPAIKAEAQSRLKSEQISFKNSQSNSKTSWQEINRIIAKFYTDKVKQINSVEDGLTALEAYYHYLVIDEVEAAGKVILYGRDNQWGQYLTLGSSLSRLGLVQPLLTAINQVIDRVEDIRSRSELNNILGDLYWITGKISQAILCQQSTITLVNKQLEEPLLNEHSFYYFKMLQVDSLLSMGLYKIDLWELSEASALLQQVIELAQHTKHHAWSEKASICLALVESYQGKTVKPAEIANKFYQLIVDKKNSQYNTGRFAYFLQILGQIFVNLNDNNKAKEIFNIAIAFSQASYYTQIKAKCLMGLATVYRNRNQLTKSSSLHQEAINLLDKIGAKCDLATAYHQWGLTLIKQKKQPKQAYIQAIQLFQQIQAPLQIAKVTESFYK